MDSPTDRIHQILKIYTDRFKHRQINTEKNIKLSNNFHDDLILSFDGKKQQLIDQLASESLSQFATIRERQEKKLVEDVLHDIFEENGRRKQYGSLI
jgi:hypothetical protein